MTLRVDVLTLFPEAITDYASTSVLGRAAERGVWELHVHDFREATDRRAPQRRRHALWRRRRHGAARRADHRDRRHDARARSPGDCPDAVGPRLHPRRRARAQPHFAGFTLLCGRYEGFDQRALDLVVDDEISIGDFVLAGGELAALCVIESVVRLLPGALGNDESSARRVLRRGSLGVPPVHQAGRRARACAYPRSCSRAITPGSTAGAGPRPCGEPWRDGAT